MDERPSRQNLIVPPKPRSAGPLLAGAVACGCAGFVIVWISGMGRTLPVTAAPLPAPPAAAAVPDPTFSPMAMPPGRNARADSKRSAAPSRFAVPVDGRPVPTGSERFPTQPASFDAELPPATFRSRPSDTEPVAPDSAVKPAAVTLPIDEAKSPVERPEPPADEATEPPQRLSRFSARQISPPETAAEPPAADRKPATPKPSAAKPLAEAAPAPVKPASDKSAAAEPTNDNPKDKSPVTEVKKPAEVESAAAKPTAPDDSVEKDQPKQAKASVASPPAGAATKLAKPEVTATPNPPPAATAKPPAASFPPKPLAAASGAAPLAAGANPFARPKQSTTTGLSAQKPSAPKPANLEPARPTLQPTAGAVPFAAAPPLTTKSVAKPAAKLSAPANRPPSVTAPAAAGATGQGRPGVPQLEGLQTPQLTVEKSGPRDLQVGKPARFEVSIRNVGSATAHDTVLKDAIPYGTSLIATMPPASPAAPGDPTGDLQWSIGELKPGQEARVAMELMPRLEGEIGSVASVSFRADATVRSRVTKPALEITAEPPQPTLIGEAMTLELTLSNPGTGTATGVVVEGQLPEAVSHPAGREVEFDVGRLEPGSTRSITLVLTTVTPGVHEIRLAARADGGIEVAQRLRAEITAPMLELAADIPSRRYLQRPATCKLTMNNTGTAPALAVELAAQLPTGMKFVRANNAGYYDERTHRVLWSLEELPAGENGTVELVVMPTTLGPQAIVAAARNPAGLADQLTHTIEVEGLAALSFEVVDSEDPIEIGGLTEYVVRVTNQGTKAATNVELAANLLGDLEPIDAKGPVPFSVENLLIAFDPLATLGPADEAVFRVRVRGRRPGNQRVQFMLKSDDLKTPLTAEEMTHVYSDR